jgi:hypothetical protein
MKWHLKWLHVSALTKNNESKFSRVRELFALRSVRAPKLGDYIPQLKIATIMKDLQLKASCRGIGWRYKKS